MSEASMTCRILGVHVATVRPLRVAGGRTVMSGIGKQAVASGFCRVGPLGLDGDEQADPTVHGGLAKAVYALTTGFPTEERYGLSQQMRRAAVSIPSNLAEGSARNGAREYAHFISVARGSLAELTTQIQIARMLGHLDDTTEILTLTDHVGRLLTGLHRKWSAQ